MNKWMSICCLLWLTVHCAGCEESTSQKGTPDVPDRPIVILYENDVHCAVDGYARLVATKREQEAMTPYVGTVSCGDFAQGDLVGSVSHGEYIVDIMNHVGYDVVTLGNHEFDYGMEQLFGLTEKLEAPVACANFRDLRTEKPVFAPYHLISYGQVDVAFVGLTTTSTPTSTSPLTYQDEEGNTIYGFSKEEFYNCAQQQIDEARAEGADYVIALCHLGDVPEDDHPTSLSLIAQTKGVDAVLDGHSHSVIPDTLVMNREGSPVLLSSTGTRFQYIGLLTIGTDGKLSSRLSDTHAADEATTNLIEEIKGKVTEAGAQVVATNSVQLIAEDSEGNRLVRLQEMPLGNLCADAFRQILNTDVAMMNGGGIRASLPVGEVTYNHLISVFPFGNVACTASLTGQQLADALEVSVRSLPEENGSFMQVSGIRFEVDTTIPSPVVIGEDELFSHIADAPRRVSHIYIKDKESDAYQPLDLEKRYTLAGVDYNLTELGSDGLFRYVTLENKDLGTDVEILAAYIEQTLGGVISSPYDSVEGRIVIK